MRLRWTTICDWYDGPCVIYLLGERGEFAIGVKGEHAGMRYPMMVAIVPDADFRTYLNNQIDARAVFECGRTYGWFDMTAADNERRAEIEPIDRDEACQWFPGEGIFARDFDQDVQSGDKSEGVSFPLDSTGDPT